MTGTPARKASRWGRFSCWLRQIGAASMLALLAGCASGPPPADWQIHAHSLLESYAKHYLDGETQLAERHFERARAEVARTGRLDLAARAELTRCAVHLAALETGACVGFERLAQHADPQDLAYARFLTGNWQGLDASRLPAHYHGLLTARDYAARLRALEEIKAPLARAIAAGALLNASQASPEVISLATRTASDQGWRRALLAWLKVQAQRAEAAGDRVGLDLIRQRIELVQSSLTTRSPSPPRP